MHEGGEGQDFTYISSLLWKASLPTIKLESWNVKRAEVSLRAVFLRSFSQVSVKSLLSLFSAL